MFETCWGKFHEFIACMIFSPVSSPYSSEYVTLSPCRISNSKSKRLDDITAKCLIRKSLRRCRMLTWPANTTLSTAEVIFTVMKYCPGWWKVCDKVDPAFSDLDRSPQFHIKCKRWGFVKFSTEKTIAWPTKPTEAWRSVTSSSEVTWCRSTDEDL